MAPRPFTRAPGTAAGRVSVWAQYTKYAASTGNIPTSSVTTLRRFIAHLLLRQRLEPSTIAGYLSHIRVALRRLGRSDVADHAAVEDAAEQVARLRPFQMKEQATPATPHDVRRLEDADPPGKGLQVRVLWHSAARNSDWAMRVPSRLVAFPAPSWVRVAYRLTKTSTKGAARTVVFRLPMRSWANLRARVALLRPGEAVFKYDYNAINAFMRRVLPGSRLTTRSLRRGAVQAMLDGGINEDEIRRLTGHKSLESLLTYADREPLVHRRAMDAAWFLLRHEEDE